MRVRILALLALTIGCVPAEGELCNNNIDDDGDGLVDCADDECADPSCLEICDDGIDNNLDNRLDCADPQCDGRGCPEVCDDGRDNDRNGLVDCAEAVCAEACDADLDGFLDGERGGLDCDDGDPAIHPDAPEICDGIDNNCNGLIDREDPDIDPDSVRLWYADADGDGFGSEIDALWECEQPPDRTDNGGDCDDEDPEVNPLTPEICNGLDDNCDGLIDDEDPNLDLSTAPVWYIDADGDGFGNPAFTLSACSQPVGHVANDLDCNDGNPDETIPSLWRVDADGDGFGAGLAQGPYGCSSPGPGYEPDWAPEDCDDTNPSIHPEAPEVCGDGIDSDCDLSDCPNFRDDFESGSLRPEWTNAGAQLWFAQPSVVHDGVYAAASGNIGNNQMSRLAIDLDFPSGGDLVFWHKGDTEANYDFLEVYVDNTLVLNRSGNWAWTEETLPMTPGLHSIEFRYQKDFSISVGADTVWLDDIVATGGVP